MKFLDLNKEYHSLKKEIDQAIARVLENGTFIGGDEVVAFEQEMAGYIGTRFAIGVNSGTDALLLSLKAFGVGPGDEVITSPFSFVATTEVIANAGAKPIFADIDPRTFNIDPIKVEEKITKRTRAIIPVHLFGQMAEMGEIMKIARKKGLVVIEDAAQAVGASFKKRKAGSWGDAGCFSFFPSKNLGAYGDGGMIVTNKKDVQVRLEQLRNHGSSPKDKYRNMLLGTNSRLDALQAAILRIKMRKLEEWNRKRLQHARFYNHTLADTRGITIPYIAPNRVHIFHQYTIRTSKRDQLKTYLAEREIPSMVYYPLVLPLQPAFSYLGIRRGDFPEAERATREVLSLPIHPLLRESERNDVVKHIQLFNSHGAR